jgi:hypothetical protein
MEADADGLLAPAELPVLGEVAYAAGHLDVQVREVHCQIPASALPGAPTFSTRDRCADGSGSRRWETCRGSPIGTLRAVSEWLRLVMDFRRWTGHTVYDDEVAAACGDDEWLLIDIRTRVESLDVDFRGTERCGHGVP